jgi:hypothetical protein
VPTVQVRYIVDPSGNPVDLFEPAIPEARLSAGS